MGTPLPAPAVELVDSGFGEQSDGPPTAFHASTPAPQTLPAFEPLPDLSRAALLGLALIALAMATSLVPAFSGLPEEVAWLLALGWTGIGLASAALSRLQPPRLGVALVGVSLGVVAVLAVTAAAHGWAPRAPGWGACGLLVVVAGLAAGLRGAALVAVAAALALLLLWLAPQAWPLAAAAPAAVPQGLQLAVLLGTLAAGGACAVVLSGVLRKQRLQARERERELQDMLAMAVDATWEIDAGYRVVSAQAAAPAETLPLLSALHGQVPWEVPAFDCDPDTLDALRADLESREPFRDLEMRWRSRAGHWRHFRVSGSPRFDKRRQFTGYVGVAREITAQVQAVEALAATETRYQELFSRIPTALVLHRNGLMLDANPAAVQLFGYEDLAAMIGRELLENYEGGDSRERARRRIETLEELPVGEALPVVDFRLLARNGRRISVRATGVRVMADGGPATLSFYVDDTERRRAEEAVRRSEALLSHLVATSPDVITLTDLASGRYAMVNHTFERATGYSAAEVIGRTSTELGLWAVPEQRAALVEAARLHGGAREMACDFIAKDGRHVQMLVSGAVFAMDRRTYLVINARDLSEQERSRLERDAILENAWVGIVVTHESTLKQANARAEALFGYAPGTMVGVPTSDLWAQPQAYDEFIHHHGEALGRGEIVDSEIDARRTDGSRFVARVVGRAIDPRQQAIKGFLWVIDDVTEQHRARDELARARDAAEAANRAKSAFLANTSHELRTPLNGMLGLAQLARDPQLDPMRRAQYLEQIVDNAQALAAILSDVLDLSKIEAGKLQLERADFWLPELLATLENTYATFAAARGLQLDVEVDASARCQVRGDALRVRQIVSNFLSNALKFTERGSVRLLARRADNGRLRIEVRDTGPGIDAATQARLFKPFTQADESTTRRFGGTGLGLSISQELARLMGGAVGVVSEPGQGACFWVELELPPVASEATAAASSPGMLDLTGLRVLMVEDNPVNMLIGVAIVERWGASVERAHDGREAVRIVQGAHEAGTPFDVVLMDVQMPVMSGHEATRELRRQPWGRDLPIVALTAAALVTERDEAMAAGMDAFLTKPIDADKLRAALGRFALGRLPRA